MALTSELEAASPSVETRAKGSSPWVSLGISALIGIVVSVAGTMIAFKLQERQPKLYYRASETLPFPGSERVVAVYRVDISNEGQKEVDEVNCYIRVSGATIEQRRVVAPGSLQVTQVVDADTIRLQVPSLNPGDYVQVLVLATGASQLPSRPEVSVRARGVNGQEKTEQAKKSEGLLTSVLSLISATLAVAGFGTSFGLLSRRLGKKRTTLAEVCRLHGLDSIAAEFEASESTYYAAGDRLAELCLREANDEESERLRGALVSLSQLTGVAADSRAAILFNLARIAAARQDTKAKDSFLKMARFASPREVERKLRVHPL